MALPSFLRWPLAARASPPNTSTTGMMPGVGPYEPLPGSNEGQRRGRRVRLLAVGGAVALALMVAVAGGRGGMRAPARVEENGAWGHILWDVMPSHPVLSTCMYASPPRTHPTTQQQSTTTHPRCSSLRNPNPNNNPTT